MGFLRDYFLPNGKHVEFWGPGSRSQTPVFLATTPFLISDLAFGTRTIPYSPFFWVAFGGGVLTSAYLFWIGVVPWVRRVTGKGAGPGNTH